MNGVKLDRNYKMISMNSKIKLPTFYCPIEPAIHPKVDEIEQRSIAWIDKFRLYNTEAERGWIIGSKSAEFSARLAPNAIEENLLLFAQWSYWGVAVDDGKCDSKQNRMLLAEFVGLAYSIPRILEAPYAPLPNNDPQLAALQNISQRLRKCATPAQIRRLIDGHRNWLMAVACQMGHLSRNYMPSINEYLTIRVNASGAAVTKKFIEIANGKEVPIQEIELPIVTVLTELTALTAALDNDFVSYWKEVHHQQIDINILSLLMYHNHCTLEQAISDAEVIRNSLMQLLLRLREQIWPQASLELRSYLSCLGHTIRGHLDWVLTAPRYTSFSDPSAPPIPAEAFTAKFTDKPDISTAPLPFPAISWWWDYLKT